MHTSTFGRVCRGRARPPCRLHPGTDHRRWHSLRRAEINLDLGDGTIVSDHAPDDGHFCCAVATTDLNGHWMISDDGRVCAFGDAEHLGNSTTPSGEGYWIFTDRGAVFPFGDAHASGNMGQVQLAGAILDSVATPTGEGYYMVASDSGIFAFGDAKFAGSMGDKQLNGPCHS